MSVSMAWAPTSTAPLKAPIVFSGNFALYPRWAMACGSRHPLTSFSAKAKEAAQKSATRISKAHRQRARVGKSTFGGRSGESAVLSTLRIRDLKTVGMIICSRRGVSAVSSRSMMTARRTNERTNERSDRARKGNGRKNAGQLTGLSTTYPLGSHDGASARAGRAGLNTSEAVLAELTTPSLQVEQRAPT
jgi:hypothetical protein